MFLDQHQFSQQQLKIRLKELFIAHQWQDMEILKIPFMKEDRPNPVDPYGISKLAAEKLLINLCETNNVQYNIAVPHNINGPKQKYDDPFRNVVSIMTNLMLQIVNLLFMVMMSKKDLFQT